MEGETVNPAKHKLVCPRCLDRKPRCRHLGSSVWYACPGCGLSAPDYQTMTLARKAWNEMVKRMGGK